MKRGFKMKHITWRLGNKALKNKSYEEIEKSKYSDAFSMKGAAYTAVPPLDQIYIPPSEYWVAKTNFVITNKLAYIIERMPGVSQFRPIEPYSFFIAVNEEFFNKYQVMSDINKKLGAVAPKK